MKFAECSYPSPAENLAVEEALLDACEDTGTEVLRIWESSETFVVLGYGNHVATEVDVEACRRDRIPILRRCSGGGTVVQGPGCLNYAVCLRVESSPALATVTGTNHYVMGNVRAAIQPLLTEQIAVHGHTDLAILRQGVWVKFSGNAQRRRKHAVLFHGTLLYGFDLKRVSDLLRFPSKQPEYRSNRDHLSFITNINVSRNGLTAALRNQWNASDTLSDYPDAETQRLARERYSTDEWNLAR